MERVQRARVMIAGTHSGSGKTTLTCGLLRALVRRGVAVAAFKCGPDYIDPMFHTKVIGAPSRNLDLFLMGQERMRQTLAQHGGEISVMEGVMGFYDGVGGKTTEASSYALSQETRTPVVLLVDCKGASVSVAAQVKGFATLRENRIAGVVLNRAPKALYADLKELIERETGIAVLGYLPALPECTVGSRHLGLVSAEEIVDLRYKMDLLADAVERDVEVDRILALAQAAEALEYPLIKQTVRHKARIAVARDAAFNFYYQDNLDLLCACGAQIVPFSPLNDAALPEGVQGIYLGGGYPELYAERLSQNISMRESIRRAVETGMPCVAECGGFLYLMRGLENEARVRHEMVGVLDAEGVYAGKLVRFGYAQLTACRDTLLVQAGEQIRVHEFHYWDSTQNGDAFCAKKPTRDGEWKCGAAQGNLFAGFAHLYFTPEMAERFLERCSADR